jgi:hypothetical protein
MLYDSTTGVIILDGYTGMLFEYVELREEKAAT